MSLCVACKHVTDTCLDQFGLKFTKGDIVVNMEKLAFFHKKHIQLALGESLLGNNRRIDEYLTKAVLQRAHEIETERKRWLVDSMQLKHQDQNSVSLLGEPIVDLTSLDGGPGVADRIRAALRISRNALTTSSVLDENRYLIWQPPAQRLKESYIGLLPELASILVQGKPGSAPAALVYFIDRLGQIQEAQWSAATVQAALDDTTKLVVYCEPDKPPVSAGYKILRWALLGLDNGPQISQVMEYLGKTETLRRLQLAVTIANSESAHI